MCRRNVKQNLRNNNTDLGQDFVTQSHYLLTLTPCYGLNGWRVGESNTSDEIVTKINMVAGTPHTPF